jgi:beta-mannanase
VRWVWSPYVSCGNCTAFEKVYPGDAYVDWVALDGYNWGTAISGTGGNRWMGYSSAPTTR